MKRNIEIRIIIIVFILSLSSCEEVTDFYLGIPLQPEFTENTFEEGMNIFGLLRPDAHGELNKSFVYIQQNWPVLEFNDSIFTITKYVDIQVIQTENETIIDTIHFPLLPPDSSFSDTLYRPAQIFTPVPGNTYQLICTHDILPQAIGKTRFPDKPAVVPGSIVSSDANIEFEIAPDNSIKMLDIYITTDVYTGITGRYITNDTASIRINLSLAGASYANIEVYGYDANLAAYYANSNTSLNFNKYRTTFSTLEEGFGVFGSLNLTKFTVDIP